MDKASEFILIDYVCVDALTLYQCLLASLISLDTYGLLTFIRVIFTFSLPSNGAQRQKWYDIIGKENVPPLSSKVKVCGRHFTDEDYVSINTAATLPIAFRKRKLKSDAVPSVHNKRTAVSISTVDIELMKAC